jgi:CubicO group peptidase (beta-lactamase class C family)
MPVRMQSPMRRVVPALLAFLALHAAPLGAQGDRAPARMSDNGAPLGFDPARLERIDRWVERLIAAKQIPGAVVMLVRSGETYHKAYGTRDLGTGAPMRTDDIFRIASQTKAITSLAVMMLWEEGRVGLDDPIGRYIPAFREQTVLATFNPADSSFESKPARRRITIRQLLTHTSGLDYADIGSAQFQAIYAKAGITAIGREGDVLARSIDALGRLPLAHEPGETFTYGLSIDVLGRLVEVVSGMPLDRFLRTRIFEPLGMRDTGFELPPDRRTRLVALHEDSAGVLRASHSPNGLVHPDFPARKVTYFAGGAGLSGTTADYARFLQLFLNGGELDGVRLLGRKTVELMLTNQIASLPVAFGLGFALETPANDHRSPASVGTFSWSGAFSTYYWADPKERLVALIYTNVYGGNAAIEGPFKALVYGALR